ncbi:DUF6714 family protein [Bradyrhizobium sp.]|uniref:DUF6714 family protein n=1 Tax=Bradyrhizobium sp. TaxID=376 RepID=UPI001ED33E50|nr:DUF6714 family protein [Bradyrhizobium sp.]MBV9978468.1 hypothetical protein [Bradyrhizobium sp.]
MRDWTMTGVRPDATRGYLDPNAFRYFLPSLLVSGLGQPEYIDWALEAILPPGRNRRTTGNWWKEFSEGFSVEQRETVCSFLKFTRAQLWDSLDLADQQRIRDAEFVWVSSESNSNE